ncbi:MAG: fasciclin domain-containing protein, partial [Prevotella sp.]|nr:fasciclin domain-containing protein [Prevotella sp.]
YQKLKFINDRQINGNPQLQKIRFVWNIIGPNNIFQEIEIVPGGRNIFLNDNNKFSYIDKVIYTETIKPYEEHIKHIQKGLSSIFNTVIEGIFDVEELNFLLSGQDDIDINDWKQNTIYKGCYNINHPVIKMFWEKMLTMNKKEIIKFLEFSTGSGSVPIDGFGSLKGVGGKIQKFTIVPFTNYSAENPDEYVFKKIEAKRCYHTIILPLYRNRQELDKAIDIILNNNTNAGSNGMTVEGSYQMNESKPIPVSYIYDQTQGGNGKSYILETPILGTRQTVRDVLASKPEFSKFLELMDGSGLFEIIHNKRNACGGTNISVFNTYHYTIYVPTNESIEALQKSGKLPTWELVDTHEEVGNYAAKTRDSLQIVNFLKYHIQDNALFIGAEEESGDFETAVIDPLTERFYRIRASLKPEGITLIDHAGNSRKVETKNGLYNLVAREFQYNSTDASSARAIETSSSAVIHQIDKPLMIEN